MPNRYLIVKSIHRSCIFTKAYAILMFTFLMSGLAAPSFLQCSGDSPTPLRSSDLGPVEASLEDLSLMTSGAFQVDAIPDPPPAPLNLEQKLNQELDYHKHGSYTSGQQPNLSSYLFPVPVVQTTSSSNWAGDLPQQVSSVQSWSKPNPYLSPQDIPVRPDYDREMSAPYSQCGPHQPSKPFERMQSWPSDLSAVGIAPQTETGTHTQCCRTGCVTVYKRIQIIQKNHYN